MGKKANVLFENYSDCCSNTNLASENSKRFEINSEEVFTKIRIDNCVIKERTEKCDFGFLRSNDDFYFVELKGSNIEKAYSQIISTIDYFEKNIFSTSKNKRYAFIVPSRVPKAGIAVKILKQDFAKKYGKVLEIKNRTLTYTP